MGLRHFVKFSEILENLMYRGYQVLKDKMMLFARSLMQEALLLIRVLNPRQRIIIIRPQNGRTKSEKIEAYGRIRGP